MSHESLGAPRPKSAEPKDPTSMADLLRASGLPVKGDKAPAPQGKDQGLWSKSGRELEVLTNRLQELSRKGLPDLTDAELAEIKDLRRRIQTTNAFRNGIDQAQ